MAGITIRSSRPSYKGKYFKGGKWNSKPLSKKAKKQVKSIVNSQLETKYFDVINSNSASTSGTIFPLTDIPVGTTDNTRIGDKLTPTRLSVRMTCFIGDSNNVMRFIFFRWKPLYGSTPPAPADILQLTASTNAVNSPLNHDERGQFTLLKDISVLMDVASYSQRQVIFSKKLSRKIMFNATSTTDVANGVYFLVISDSSAIPHPSFNYYTRVTYKDA